MIKEIDKKQYELYLKDCKVQELEPCSFNDWLEHYKTMHEDVMSNAMAEKQEMATTDKSYPINYTIHYYNDGSQSYSVQSKSFQDISDLKKYIMSVWIPVSQDDISYYNNFINDEYIEY